MPHQVVKCATRGSVGDLAKITAELEDMGVNIVAVGGGEGPGHVGIVSLLLDPDKENMGAIVTRLRNLVLDPDAHPPRKLTSVDTFPDVHILLNDTPGQLKKAAEALAGINIETVISIGKRNGKADVSLGFTKANYDNARQRLVEAPDVEVVDDPHHDH